MYKYTVLRGRSRVVPGTAVTAGVAKKSR